MPHRWYSYGLGVTYLQEQAAKEDLEAKRERRRRHVMDRP